MATPPLPLEYGGISLDTIATAVKSKAQANGLALILYNDYSTTSKSLNLTTLPGAVHDGKKMESSFTKLNFAILVMPNLTMQATVDVLREIARFKNYPATYKRLVIIFSGHGASDQRLYANDGITFTIENVVTLLNPRQAPHLGNIPKLFFIDACRGKLRDYGVYIPKGERELHQMDTPIPKGGNVRDYLRVPSKGNCLIAYSTLPEYLSFEHEGEGGLWMSCLAEKVATMDKTVTDILIDVNRELLRKFNSGLPGIQQPEYISQLNEPINFFAEAGLQESIKAVHEECDDSTNDENKQPNTTSRCYPRYCQPRVIYPTQCCSDCQERLKSYCIKEGKPQPKFDVSYASGRTFIAKVYVAKTRGWTKGEPASSRHQAQENAARTLLNLLQL